MIPVVVQARMGSTRCPGKVLRSVAGQPLLSYLLDRLDRWEGGEPIIVATSTLPADDAIAAYCTERRVRCFRGSETDVASRFVALASEPGVDAVIRISGDSPMFDVEHLDRAIALYREAPGVELVTNVRTRTFPKGQSVELFASASFVATYARFEEPGDFEHVGPYFYRHLDQFHVRSFDTSPAVGEHSMVIDTEAEFAAFERLVASLSQPHWRYSWRELMELQLGVAS